MTQTHTHTTPHVINIFSESSQRSPSHTAGPVTPPLSPTSGTDRRVDIDNSIPTDYIGTSCCSNSHAVYGHNCRYVVHTIALIAEWMASGTCLAHRPWDNWGHNRRWWCSRRRPSIVHLNQLMQKRSYRQSHQSLRQPAPISQGNAFWSSTFLLNKFPYLLAWITHALESIKQFIVALQLKEKRYTFKY